MIAVKGDNFTANNTQIRPIFFIIIFIQKKRKPLYLEYEAPIDDEFTVFRNLDLFSKSFDRFSNQDFSKLQLILDIENFVKNKNYEPEKNKSMFRQMTLFQAVVSELHPKLEGRPFYAKVAEFEEKWEINSFHLNDAKKLHDFFGLGIQIWTKVAKPDRHYEVRKIWDTIYKKKLRIQLQDFDLEKRFPLSTIVEYIFDEVAINYFSCSNKNCFYGTARLDHFERHKKSCVTSTRVEYRQERNEKRGEQVREELVAEGILPDKKFENMMYCVFDIGKFRSISKN